MRCQSTWYGVHCTSEEAVERVFPYQHSHAIADAQLKMGCNRVSVCEACWPRSRPYLLCMFNYPQEDIDAAMAEAGMTHQD